MVLTKQRAVWRVGVVLVIGSAFSLPVVAQQSQGPTQSSLIGFMNPGFMNPGFTNPGSINSSKSGESFASDDSDQSGSSASQSTNTAAGERPGLISRSIKRTLQDQKELYAAPFKKSNLKWDALFLAGTGGLLAADRHIRKALPDSNLSIYHAISNSSIASISIVSGGVWLYGRNKDHEHAHETGNLELEALVNTFLVYAPMQLLAGRERPDEGTGNGRFWIHNRFNSSFPGGHSMFTFTMASVLAHEYPKPWVQFLSYGAATGVTAGRLLGRNHFASDLLVGSVLGYLIGSHIFHAHCKMGLSSSCHNNETSSLELPDQP